jgi:putative membrane protein
MWWYGAHQAAFGWWILFPILWFLFWVTVVGLAVWLIRTWPRRDVRFPQDPLDILRRRLATGEITEQQFNDVRKVLEG